VQPEAASKNHISLPGQHPDQKRDAKRELLQKIYTAELGTTELSGMNDGKRVEEYLHYVGLGKGNAWCAAFVCWVLGKAGINNPRSAWAPALFPQKRVVWQRNKTFRKPTDSLNLPHTGDVFGLYFPEKGRIAHVGFVDDWQSKWVITAEGNTNAEGSREGNGVYRRRRLVNSVYQVASYN